MYVDFKTILKKTICCENNPEILYMTEIDKDIACGLSIFVKFMKMFFFIVGRIT